MNNDSTTERTTAQGAVDSVKAIRRLLQRFGGFPTRKQLLATKRRKFREGVRKIMATQAETPERDAVVKEVFEGIANEAARQVIWKAVATCYARACQSKAGIYPRGRWILETARKSLVRGEFGASLTEAASGKSSTSPTGQDWETIKRHPLLSARESMGSRLDTFSEPESGNSNRAPSKWSGMEHASGADMPGARPGKNYDGGGAVASEQSDPAPYLGGLVQQLTISAPRHSAPYFTRDMIDRAVKGPWTPDAVTVTSIKKVCLDAEPGAFKNVKKTSLLVLVSKYEAVNRRLPVRVSYAMNESPFALLQDGKLHLGPDLFAEYEQREAAGGALFWSWLEQTEVYEIEKTIIIDV
jgi:hypothetical protein